MKSSNVSTETKKAYKEAMNGSSHAVERMQSLAEQTLDSAQEKARELSSKFGTEAERMYDRSSEVLDRAIQVVRRRPVESSVVAAAAGVILGSLIFMYRGRRRG